MKKGNIKKILGRLYGVLILEDIILHKHRRTLVSLVGFVVVIFFTALIFMGADTHPKIRGAFLVSLSVYLLLISLESYFYSFYKRSHDLPDMVPFEIGNILLYCEDQDITKGFLFSDFGDQTMKRLGITEEEITEFIKRIVNEDFSNLQAFEKHPSSPEAFGTIIYESDEEFRDFLFKNGIKLQEFIGAFEWVIEQERNEIEAERWWSKDRLLRVPGLGKNWAYGETFILEKFGNDITDIGSSFLPSYETLHNVNVIRLESILCKAMGANCIITSDDEASRMDIVTMLARKIRESKALLPLIHKRVYVLDTNLIIENSKDKITFEREFMSTLFQAMSAQNVILVIPYLTSFIKSAEAIGSDVVSLLSPYLSSPLLHIIGLDSKTEFHADIEKRDILMEHFQVLKIEVKSGEGILSMLKIEALEIEKHSHLLITYPALLAISESSKRYFDTFAYADKAKDLLLEAVPYCLSRGLKKLMPAEVLELVSSRTGVPVGVPAGEEKDMLLNMEEILHKKIVGQEEAVKAISQALRRSRAGVRNTDRPIGSFLFLGPTGVGKTETTKALAEIFFKSGNAMSRLDMSEFKGSDALASLIGSFDSGKSGILATVLREKPYGVLLLDEFEKTNSDVLNLFLQILDEGFFSDGSGKKVNARNNIIIATSNAGSSLIWEAIKAGEDISKKKDQIIEALVNEGVFKPELLNRFDGVILFHPLAQTDLRKIATLMLDKFAKRMLEKGISIKMNDEIISYLVAKGTDPKFGARPMNRAIQEEVEEVVAEAIISGSISQGQSVSFEIGSDNMLKIIKT